MLELKHPVYITRAIQDKAEQASKDTIYQAWFPWEPAMLEWSHACHLRFYLVFQGDLLVPFRACSHGAVVSETTQCGPKHLFLDKPF